MLGVLFVFKENTSCNVCCGLPKHNQTSHAKLLFMRNIILLALFLLPFATHAQDSFFDNFEKGAESFSDGADRSANGFAESMNAGGESFHESASDFGDGTGEFADDTGEFTTDKSEWFVLKVLRFFWDFIGEPALTILFVGVVFWIAVGVIGWKILKFIIRHIFIK